MNIRAECITALKGLGYSEREAEFLYIVAAHSGFFLQRQFTQFVDVMGRGPATPATRAAIIEQLIAVGYIERKKKVLLPTEKGKALINQVHPTLKHVALTASWEQQLANIQDGTTPADFFATAITQFVQDIFPDIIAGRPAMTAVPNPNIYGPCPKCKTGTVRKTIKGAGCSRFKESCNFSIWGQINGKKLTDEHIRHLVTKGRTELIKGFKKKDGSGTYAAHLAVSDEFKVKLEFEPPTNANKLFSEGHT